MTSASKNKIEPPIPLNRRQRRRWGPILVGLLFLLLAIGISVDHFARYFRHEQSSTDTSLFTFGSDIQRAPASFAESLAAMVDASTADVSSLVELSPELSRSTASVPALESESASAAPSPNEVHAEPVPEDLKVSLDPSLWDGQAQLLPNPTRLSQLTNRRRYDLRGGGWFVIDVAKSRVEPVELFRNPTRGVIEAKYLDGRLIVNPTNTGFALARGVSGVTPGPFEVFESPPCLVRYSGVSEQNICEVRWRDSKIRFRFSPQELVPGEPKPDFIFTTVEVDNGPGEISRARWKKMTTFNESFHPIGDVNHDGYPDFYVESVTDYDESGTQSLLMSAKSGDDVDYQSISTRFRPSR